MATIEERAIEWAKSVSPWITKYDTARAIDYKIGALEQRKIDIDKACEALYGLMNDLGCDLLDIEKAKEYMRKIMLEE